ncbi:helix-turn-helix domain-containing protein [Streptomyces sp. NBC_00879]|uniref:helix-turn-helix domain-containing protein n=1 Tax=Streptomyces sp. NBC_00879 TaxID=2975855 RepID=UPI003866D8AE|nr:helix-turn-helix domain-containing protein [Streptomyces sp. NBC_00879]
MATPEAEEFAALLRQLKDRSGRSYGVLAGKLHVSTSTLHRYCNGDAVPTDYAPVERLARLCAATPDELVDLHRRWILADGARKRARAEVPQALEAEVPVAATEPEVAPDAAVSPRGRDRNRIRIALAAGAVVALAVPAAFVAVHAATGDEGGKKSGAVAGASVPPDTTAPRTTSPSVSPSGSPSASTSPSGSPSPWSAPSRQEALPATGGVPLRVGVSSYNWEEPCGQYYLLDQAPDAVPPPPAPQDNRSWARALGGVDGGHMLLQLTATGKTADSVVLNAVHVRVVARSAPLDWKAYSMSYGCGGGITPQTFDIDLDAAHPPVKPVAGQDGDTVVPAKDFPYKVASDDPQVLNLDVHTEGHDVSWYLELDWSSGDRRGTVRMDDGGKPFRTSAMNGRTEYGYWPDKSAWVEQSAS